MALSKSTELFDRSGPCLRNRRNRRTYQTAWKVGAIPERTSQNYSRQKTSTREGDTGTASESGIESRAKLAPNPYKTGVSFFSFCTRRGEDGPYLMDFSHRAQDGGIDGREDRG